MSRTPEKKRTLLLLFAAVCLSNSLKYRCIYLFCCCWTQLFFYDDSLFFRQHVDRTHKKNNNPMKRTQTHQTVRSDCNLTLKLQMKRTIFQVILQWHIHSHSDAYEMKNKQNQRMGVKWPQWTVMNWWML